MKKERKKNKRKLDEHLETIKKLIAEGKTGVDIAYTFGVTPTTVCSYCKLHNINLPRYKGKKDKSQVTLLDLTKPKNAQYPNKRTLAMIAMYFENYTLEEVAQKFGVSRERVRQRIKHLGYKTRKTTVEVQPFTPKNKGLTSIQLFWKNVKIGKLNQCWEWQGCTCANGYGLFSFYAAERYAHRISFWIANHKKAQQHILHSCDNRKCVNPAHLREGTSIENVKDRHFRNYENWYKSRFVTNTELTDTDVINIIKASRNGVTGVKIAKKYNLAYKTVYDLLNGRTEKYKNFLEKV